MTTTRPALDATERYNLMLSAGVIVASLALASSAFTAAVALGSAIEVVNYRVLRRAAERFLSGQLVGGRAWTAGYALRLLFVGVAIALALSAGAHPLGLVLGLSVIVPAAVLGAWRTRPPALPSVAAPAPDDPSWERWNAWLARERDEAEEQEDS